jgi:hypothetical protein
MLIFGIGILSFMQIYKLYEKINYDQLCNPIFIFTPLYIGLFFATRLGIFFPFNPRYSFIDEIVLFIIVRVILGTTT